MKTKKIVITGGPCAGKTTGLVRLDEELTKMGYRVVFLNESATELAMNNISLKNCKNNYEFEKNILKLQLEKEKLYMQFCESLPDENVLLVCDRGSMDCKAYTTEEEFKRLLKDFDTNEILLRDNYDAVFHLVTAAKGATEFYTNANNKARREGLQEAIKLDDATMSVWVGHPHFRVIDNSTNFENKIKRLINEICLFLGIPTPLEIERKYLIERPDLNLLASLKNCRKVDIIQTYLTTNKNEERRVRQRGINGNFIFTLTNKIRVSNVSRIETEKRITEREYLNLLNEADTRLHQIKKERYCLMDNNKYYEIDIYPFAKHNAICEIELASEDEKFTLPNFIKLKKEVTNDNRFSNHSIARKIPDDLLN